MQALQEDARQRALAHLGMSSTVTLKSPEQTVHLPTEWEIAVIWVLTPAQKKV